MTGPGLAALPEGGRLDFASLRRHRQDRLFEAMAGADLDALVLGRPADIAFATGVRQLWTAGSRPFSPACIVVADGRRVHLLATWDEGVPDDIPREHLFGLSWNPSVAAGHVRAVPGLADAKRIGSGGASVGLRRLLDAAAPSAELVDARRFLHAARTAKGHDELDAIETACAIAEAGLSAMRAELSPGITTRRLLGAHALRLGQLGAPVVPDESVARTTDDGFRTVVDDRPLRAGSLVALSPSASYAGYEGTLARTFAVGGDPDHRQSDLGDRCRSALDAVIDACVPGSTGGDLTDRWSSGGGTDFPAPLVHGIGLGAEPPVIGMGLGESATLAAGTALAVQGWMHEPGVGGWLERDVVVVSDDGPRCLTRWAT